MRERFEGGGEICVCVCVWWMRRRGEVGRFLHSVIGGLGVGTYEMERCWSEKVFNEQVVKCPGVWGLQRSFPLQIDTQTACKDLVVHDSLRSCMYLI